MNFKHYIATAAVSVALLLGGCAQQEDVADDAVAPQTGITRGGMEPTVAGVGEADSPATNIEGEGVDELRQTQIGQTTDALRENNLTTNEVRREHETVAGDWNEAVDMYDQQAVATRAQDDFIRAAQARIDQLQQEPGLSAQQRQELEAMEERLQELALLSAEVNNDLDEFANQAGQAENELDSVER